MLHEDSNLPPSPGLGSSSSSLAQPPSTSSKSIATSIYTMPLDEEDPWGDTAVREPATNTRVLTPTGPYSTGKSTNQETSFGTLLASTYLSSRDSFEFINFIKFQILLLSQIYIARYTTAWRDHMEFLYTSWTRSLQHQNCLCRKGNR